MKLIEAAKTVHSRLSKYKAMIEQRLIAHKLNNNFTGTATEHAAITDELSVEVRAIEHELKALSKAIAEAEAVNPMAWPCSIVTADFEENTVTLEMENTDYKVAAGRHWLTNTHPSPVRKLKPYVWEYRVNNAHYNFSTEKPPEDAYDEGTLKALYEYPPNSQSARSSGDQAA